MTPLEQAQALLREAARLAEDMPRSQRIKFLYSVQDMYAAVGVSLATEPV